MNAARRATSSHLARYKDRNLGGQIFAVFCVHTSKSATSDDLSGQGFTSTTSLCVFAKFFAAYRIVYQSCEGTNRNWCVHGLDHSDLAAMRLVCSVTGSFSIAAGSS